MKKTLPRKQTDVFSENRASSPGSAVMNSDVSSILFCKVKNFFSTVECFIVVSILAVTVSVGNFSRINKSTEHQVTHAVHFYSELFSFARNEALSREKTIVVCQTQDKMVCADQFSNDYHWMVYYLKQSADGAVTQKWVLKSTSPIPTSFDDVQVKGNVYRIDFDNQGQPTLYQQQQDPQHIRLTHLLNNSFNSSESLISYPILISDRNTVVGLNFTPSGTVELFNAQHSTEPRIAAH